MKAIIDINAAIRVFKALASLDEIDARGSEIIKSAVSSICNRVKPEYITNDNMDRICFAVGTLAYYRYLLSDKENGFSSFKAGDVTLSKTPDIDSAREFYLKAMEDISDIIIPSRFAFRRI